MTIIRRGDGENPYAIICRAMLQDQRLSIDTRGLLALLMSLSGDWQVQMTWCAEQCGVGRERLRRMMAEAVDAGYVVRTHRRDAATGQMTGWDYVVSDAVTDGRVSRSSVTPSVIDNRQKQILDISPPPPSTTLIEELRGDGCASHVLDVFVAPVLQSIRIGHPDPRGLMRDVCDALADQSGSVLALAAANLVATRKKIISKKCMLDAVRGVADGAIRRTAERLRTP